jgi:DNA-binding MarR family transcriptional regulator
MKKSAFDPVNQQYSTDGKIVAALERIAQAFRVMLWNEGKAASLSPIQLQVLIFLLHHHADKRKVSYLADEFNMTKATISDTVKSLEEKLCVEKEYDTNDNRSYTLQLTRKGKQLAEKTSHFASELQAPVENIPPVEKEELLLKLLGIIRHLNQAGIITVQRMCFTCSHYKATNNGKTHFCQLLNQKLKSSDLRIDCPEHMTVAI